MIMRSAAFLAAFVLAGSALAANDTPQASTAPVPKGAYTVDKAHTSLVFRVNHIGFSNYTGRFTRFDAQLQFDPTNIAASQLTVKIDPRSIEADNAPSGFLQTLAGKDWLDADRFPEMTFRTKSIETTGAQTFRIRGELSLHGVTKPVTLEARYNGGYAGHPFDPHARIGFSARGSLKRSDFGVSYGIPAPGTTMGVSDQVEITIETEFSGPPLANAGKEAAGE
jgi:polyisoprenoid-binding protein YceI